MQEVFGTTALGFTDWLYLLLLAVVVIFAEEARKLFSRKFTKTAEDLSKHDHV